MLLHIKFLGSNGHLTLALLSNLLVGHIIIH